MRKHFVKHRRLKAFSLMELLVSVAILSFISIAVFDTMLVGQRTFYSGTGTLELQGETRRGFYWITKELREATTHTITVINSNDDTLVFSTPTKASINYYRDISDANSDGITTQVIREYPAGTWTVVANKVTSLKFTDATNSVVVDMTLSMVSGSKTLTLTPRTKVEVRNE